MSGGDEVIDFCHECFVVIEGQTLEKADEEEDLKFNRIQLDLMALKEENKDLKQQVEDQGAASVKLAEQLLFERDNWDYAREVILAFEDYLHLKQSTGVPIRMGDQRKAWMSLVMAYEQYHEWEHNL